MKRLVCHCALILRPISAVCLYLDSTAATFSLALCADFFFFSGLVLFSIARGEHEHASSKIFPSGVRMSAALANFSQEINKHLVLLKQNFTDTQNIIICLIHSKKKEV